MALLVYNTAIFLYILFLKFGAFFNKKASELVRGRKNWKKKLAAAVSEKGSWIWMHCASLGEFEQGRPLLEEIKKRHPQYKFLITFYSPSGYTVRKNYEFADAVLYMPSDTRANATFFVEQLKPVLAIFVKYEFWYHHLTQLHVHHVKSILISAAFRKEQPFFKWYGGLFRKLLFQFNALFVQDNPSAKLLQEIGVKENVFVTGDTRYDRVAEIAGETIKIDEAAFFLGGSKALIAGSTWPEDEKMIFNCLAVLPDEWKLIVAPHELSQSHLKFIEDLFGDRMIFYSRLKNDLKGNDKKILVIDNIGMLSSLYAYGSIAFVGGGFQRGGIHNILEPAIFGAPVLFGPNYQKFTEAQEMKDSGFAFPVNNAEECKRVLQHLVQDGPGLVKLNNSIKKYIHTKTGATASITQHITRSGWV